MFRFDFSKTAAQKKAASYFDDINGQIAAKSARLAELQAEQAELQAFLSNPYRQLTELKTALQAEFDKLIPDVDSTIDKRDPQLAVEIALLQSKMGEGTAVDYAHHPRFLHPLWRDIVAEKPSKQLLQAYWILIACHWSDSVKRHYKPKELDFYQQWFIATGDKKTADKFDQAHQALEAFQQQAEQQKQSEPKPAPLPIEGAA